MTTLVSRLAPNFTATAVLGDGTFKQISLSEFKNKKYVILYFYPFDFTFVCPSEIIAFDKALNEFQSRDVELLGCSVDSQFTHNAWKNTPIEKGGIGNIKHTLISDVQKNIANSYGVLHEEGMALRGLFLIDKAGIVRHSVVNDLPLGRSVEEVIRIIDALQYNEKNGEVCPANWKKGMKAMKPTADGVAKYLSAFAK